MEEMGTIERTEGAQRGMGADEQKVYSRGQVLAVMLSVLLGILLAALDQTIVGPALPKIIGELRGFDYYTWVVTIYMLTSTISVPIVGKLSDMYGRKWFYVAGVVIFVLGSALSGIAADMLQLVLYRGLQGIGAGVLFGLAFAIIADLIPPADRGKWQGLFGSVFGLASVIGPTIGGLLTDHLSWRWVFYVNVPVGVVAIGVLLFTFPDEKRKGVHKDIDWLGAGALIAAITPLLLALSFGGTRDWEWGSFRTLGMLAVSALFLAIFLYVESRAKEPIIALDIFKNRTFTISTIAVFMSGLGMFGAVIYIPLFIQAIQGDSATNSGNAVTPMTLTIVLSSVITGQVISRTGKYKAIGIVGMGLVTLGLFLLYTMNMDTPRLTTIGYMVVMGLGMGVAFPLYTLIVQNAFPIQRVGAVTAALQFFRSIGGTVGTAVLGTLVNNHFHDNFGPELEKQVQTLPPEAAANVPLQQLTAGLSGINPQGLVSAEGAAQLKAQLLQVGVPEQFVGGLMDLIFKAMKPALFGGIQMAFLIGTVMVAVGFVATIFLKEIPLRKSNYAAPERSASPGGERAGWSPTGAKPAMATAGVTAGDVAEAGQEMAASGMPGATVLPTRDEPRLGDRK